jgi:hypothetical protein
LREWGIGGIVTYLSHITANLPDLRQELDHSHPLLGAESRLSDKIMQMRDGTVEQEFRPPVGTLRVDDVYVLGDVVDGEIFHGHVEGAFWRGVCV